MGNTVVPKILAGDVVQQLVNGKITEPKFIVLSVSKEGVQLSNQIWYPIQDFVAVQNKGLKKNSFLILLEYFTRRNHYRMMSEYSHQCQQNKIIPNFLINTIYNENIISGREITLLLLSNQNITDNHAIAISNFLLNGTQLKQLDLSKNFIGLKGANAILSCLTNNNTLKKLNLSENHIKAVPSFYSLKYNTKLDDLNLSKTGIGAKGCDDLIDSLLHNPSSSICKLDLRYEGIGDEQISKLMKFTSENRSICILEIYPSSLQKEEPNDDGWLSYEGWEDFSKLRKILSENIEYRKMNPHIFEDFDSLESYYSYLSYGVKKLGDNAKKVFNEKILRVENEDLGPKSFDEWKNFQKTVKGYHSPIISLDHSINIDDSDDWIVLNTISSLNDDKLSSEKTNEREKRKTMVIECSICFDEISSKDIYIMDECDHKFCRECLIEYITSKIKSGETDSIRCPDLKCKREMKLSELKQLVSQELIEKYDEFSLKKALAQMKNVIYCLNDKCNNAMIVDTEVEDNMIICNNEDCKMKICIQCKVPYHDGISCEEYQKWKLNSQESEKQYSEWAQKNSKKCPQCKTDIEKSGGCNHMKCTKCGCNWCWICGESFKSTYSHFGFTSGTCHQYSF
eukprot:gene1708-477_t